MKMQVLVLIYTVCSLTIIALKYKNSLLVLAKSTIMNERIQSVELLAALQQMVKKLDYRDNFLIKEREQAITENMAKSDFLVNMSHELRTPMHAILNFADMGKCCIEHGDVKKVETCFLRITDSSERLLNLINGLLDLTRLESGRVTFKFTENNIIDCIYAVRNELSSLIEKKNIKIEIVKRNSVSTIKFDKENIIRVLINIISNAIKFSPENSSVIITIDYGKHIINGKEKTKGIKVSVEDNGPGINTAETELIFAKFIQGSNKIAHKAGGSGIGLAICKEIISAHKGMIWAENKDTGGAKINFIIPE